MPIEKRLALKTQFPDAEHPVVRTHPETGEKILFVNAFTTHFTIIHTAENVRYGQDYAPGAAPTAAVPDQPGLQIPEYQVRWRWKPNSVAFWDNRATNTTPSWITRRVIERWSAPASRATPRSELALSDPRLIDLPSPQGIRLMNFLDGALFPKTRISWSLPRPPTARNGCLRISPRTCRSPWTIRSRRRSIATTPAPPFCTFMSAKPTARAPSAFRSSTNCWRGYASPCRTWCCRSAVRSRSRRKIEGEAAKWLSDDTRHMLAELTAEAGPSDGHGQHGPDEHFRADGSGRLCRHVARRARVVSGLSRDDRAGRPDLGRGAYQRPQRQGYPERVPVLPTSTASRRSSA